MIRRLCSGLALIGIALICVFYTVAPVSAATSSAVVEIVTVPALPGARFSFDGKTYQADKQGVVRLSIKKETRLHTISVLDTKVHEKDRDLAFVRWWYTADHDQDFRTDLTGVRVHHNLRIKAGFRATYLLKYSFSDSAQGQVNRERVTRVEFAGSNGQTISSNGSGKVRMVGVRPVVKDGTLLANQVRYTVQRVDVDGSNVVQVNQQMFVPSHQSSVVVPLLLKTAHFSTRDFLFGMPIGKAVHLTFPDGRQSVVPLDSAGKATVDGLARGRYTVRVDAPGYSFDRPVALSRNQYIDLPVLSYLDMVVLGTVGIMCVTALYVLRSRTRRLGLQAAQRVQLRAVTTRS